MKKLIIFIFLIFLIATTFLSDNPPGWYQQQLPLSNVTVQDIYFIDSLKGWVSARKNSTNDTAYILNTSDGGENWTVQFKDSIRLINAIQFLDENTGYGGGGFGRAKFLKTTNGGINWQSSTPPGLSFYSILDLKFVNKDTGWVCNDASLDGGIFKTTNGGGSWVRQTTASQLAPVKLFFINQDTGWALTDNQIFKTINGGTNWTILNTFGFGLKDLFFISNDTGWIIRNSSNGIFKTTDGGLNWLNEGDPFSTNSGLNDIFMLSESKGWIPTSLRSIFALTDSNVWGVQNTSGGYYISLFMLQSNIGYSGGNLFIKTEDGGGVITDIEDNTEIIPEDFKLNQNYPNPFNPETIISYELRVTGYVKLRVFDIQGKEVGILTNQRQIPGKYNIEFSSTGRGSELSSGVYYYRLEVVEENSRRINSQTRKMILVR